MSKKVEFVSYISNVYYAVQPNTMIKEPFWITIQYFFAIKYNIKENTGRKLMINL